MPESKTTLGHAEFLPNDMQIIRDYIRAANPNEKCNNKAQDALQRIENLTKVNVTIWLNSLLYLAKNPPDYIDYDTRWRIIAALEPIIEEVSNAGI